MILYQSDDLASTVKQFNDGYRAVSADGPSHTLAILQAVANSPLGKALGVFFMWSSPDVATGEFWLNKTCLLGPVSMHTVERTTLLDWLNMTGNMPPESCYASMLTVILRRLTPAAVDAIATDAPNFRSESLSVLSIHNIRDPGAKGKHIGSVFPTREPHYIVEILPAGKSLCSKENTDKWAQELCQALLETDPENILPGKYLPFAAPTSFDAREIFGAQHQYLAALKRAHNPQNIFPVCFGSSVGRYLHKCLSTPAV